MDKKKFIGLLVFILVVYIIVKTFPELYQKLTILLSIYPVEVTLVSLIVGTVVGFLISSNIIDGGKF